MNTTNVYDNLYNNMKNAMTVVNDGLEYNLGEYMLMKAGKTAKKSGLPAKMNTDEAKKAISTFFRYVEDKFTLKKAPVKDRTMRTFPLRTSLTALACALIVTCFGFSYGAATLMSVNTNTPAVIEASKDANQNETVETNYEYIEQN